MEDAPTQSVEDREGQGFGEDERKRLDAVVDIFSRLSIACKSRSLYPVDHPAARDAVTVLHAVMEDSLKGMPTIRVQVGRDSLVFENWIVGERTESLRQLASRIRSLNIQEICFEPGVTFPEAEALVELLISGPEGVENAGGAESFLLARGIHGISVVESAAQRADEEKAEDAAIQAGAEAEVAPPELESPEAMEPEKLKDLLQLLLNPEELGHALMGLGDGKGRILDKRKLTDAIFFFLRDAAIFVEREYPYLAGDCYRSMAESLLFLETKVRNLLLFRHLLPKLREEPVCAAILGRFNAQEIADVLSQFFPIAQELTPKAGGLLKAMGFREAEVRHALRLLRNRLIDLGQVPPSLLPALEMGLERERARGTGSDKLPTLDEISVILGEYPPEEMEEIRRIADFDPGTEMPADVAPMLLDLLMRGGKLDNPGKAVELLIQSFWSLAMSAQLDPAAAVLEGTREILRNPDPALDPFRADLTRMLEEAASERVARRVIQLACGRRNDPRAVQGLKRYMCGLEEKGIAVMVEALGAEENMSVRKYIINVLTELGKDRLALLGAYVNDPRWYLVRNIVTIMARFHSPETIPYLRRTFIHPNPKVRAETIRALGLTGGKEASDLLLQGLENPEERERVLCIRWLGRLEESRALNRLVNMLEDREPGAESLRVKKEIILSLGRIKDPETFQVLKKYRDRQKWLNRAEWQEINLASEMALQSLARQFPHLERQL